MNIFYSYNLFITLVMSMQSDHENTNCWSSLIQSLADKENLYPEMSSPILPIDGSLEARNALLDGDNEVRPGINEGGKKPTEKEIDEEKQEGAKGKIKGLGKRSTESRNLAEKRRRTDIRTKIEDLKQLTPNCKKKDIASTLDCIINHIRWMKLYVESQSAGPMLPLGMRMDFPAPWFLRSPPFLPSNLTMPVNSFTLGEISGHNPQTVPITKGFNNQAQLSKAV